MSKRGVVSDFRGTEVREGDTVVWWARHGNTTRGSEGKVTDVTTEKYKGRLIPKIVVKPTGRCTGFVARVSLDLESILSDQWVVADYAEDAA